MFKRQRTWLLLAGALLLFLLALNFLDLRAARSRTEVNHSFATYRSGEALPENMAPGFTLFFAVTGEERLAAALETALRAELEEQPSVGTATVVAGTPETNHTPFLLVELSSERLWTPFYGRASVAAQIYYANDGDAPRPLDEAVVIRDSPSVKANGEFTLLDTTWGLVSKPADAEYLAKALAEATAAALQKDVFTAP